MDNDDRNILLFYFIPDSPRNFHVAQMIQQCIHIDRCDYADISNPENR